MQKNRKFFVLLVLLCTVALFGIPFLSVAEKRDKVSQTAAVPASSLKQATRFATEKTTTPAANSSPAPASSSAVEELKKETFTVLHADGKTISTISCREFLIFTLAAEMLPSFELEALKAQAVAAYTYFCYEREREKENPQKSLCGADFADTPVPFPEGYTAAYWQKKWGRETYAAAYEKLAAAVDAVAGQQITYKGKPILAAYHAVSPGKTEVAETVWASALPYLQSVDSSADKNAPDFTTTVRFSVDEFKAAVADLKGIDLSSSPDKWISPEITRSAAGTVLKLTVGSVALTGRECRTRFGLRSACFSVVFEQNGFTFTVTGHGHGVGLSQYGAQFAAQNGDNYIQILHHYYTDVEIK